MRVIYIHWLRHMRRYTRSRTKLLASFCQPILYLLAVGYGLQPTFRDAGQGDFLEFLAPGVIATAVVLTALFSGIDLLMERQTGFLKSTLVAPASRALQAAGRIVGAGTAAAAQGLMVLGIALVIGFRPDGITALAQALACVVLIAVLFTALGIVVALTVPDFNAFGLFTNTVVWPMMFFSGWLFPLTNAPGWLLAIASVNPVTYGVDGMRTALVGSPSPFGFAHDAMILTFATALALTWCGWRFRRLRV